MSRRGESERIEVTLTSTAPEQRRTERSVVSTDEPPGDGVPRAPLPRPSAVVTATIAAALALGVGVMIGRSGGTPGDAATESAPATQPTATTTTNAPGGSDVELLPLPPPTDTSTTELRRPTFPGEADHLADSTPARVDVVPDVAELPIEIVGISVHGPLVTLDATTGSVTRMKLTREVVRPPTVHAGDGWVLVPPGGTDERASLVRDGGAIEAVDVGDDRALLMVPGTDRLWREPTGTFPTATGPVMVEISLLDGPTGETLTAPGELLGADPRSGGLAVEASGGTYVVTPDGAERLTPGRLVGFGRERALVHECDETLSCGYAVVDRSSGERRPLQLARPGWSSTPSCTTRSEPGRRCALDEGAVLEAMGWWWALPEPMSPTEDRMLVVVRDTLGADEPSQGILDLDTGAYWPVASGVAPMAWGPNGDLVFRLEADRLLAHLVESGTTIDVAPDFDRLLAFTWRPRAATAGPDATGPLAGP